MTGPTSPSDPLPESDGQAGGPLEHRTPRWVKVAIVLIGVLVVLIVAMMLLGDGNHGPGRHLSAPAVSAVMVTDTADHAVGAEPALGVVGT